MALLELKITALPLGHRVLSACLSVQKHFRWFLKNFPLCSVGIHSTPSQTQPHWEKLPIKINITWGFHYKKQLLQTLVFNLVVNINSLPSKNFGVGVHDIQRLFKAPILNKANYFTVKGRRVIFVFMQNYDRWDAKPKIKLAKTFNTSFQMKSL